MWLQNYEHELLLLSRRFEGHMPHEYSIASATTSQTSA